MLLRDAENISADQLQRILGSQFWQIPAISGVGTGFSTGGVGLQNPNWLGTANPLTGHMAVTANGTTMVLTILPGWALVIRDRGVTSYDPRLLFAESDANDSVTVTSNSTGSTRNDTVCLKVDMNTAPASDGSNLVSFVILAGASGGGLPNAPADGNLYLPLCNVAVANGATSISTANITDKRVSGLSGWNPYGARAYASSAAAVDNRIVPLQSKTYDPNGNFDTTNFWYVAPCPGYFQFIGEVSVASTTALFTTYLKKNGTVIAYGNEIAASASQTGRSSVSDILSLATGDQVALWTGSSAATNDNATSPETFLTARFLNN